ncbi:Dopamine beta-hydroxylase [Folsomia candida]|uniref:Dopamine beta-hydroxylase n=1 Tax=Folsomia candida TaxID=158441 RepID=A0A226D9Q3_FOLCA|nr:Dopamine beta-hydroxylase [Folsomia candida]
MKLVAIAVVLAFGFVEPHGYLMEPLARTSIHLDPNQPYNPPYWYDNKGVWCNNVHQDLQYSQCGSVERPLVTTTLPKVIIEIKAGLDNAHFGHFQMELCAQEQETNNCFNLLPVVSASQPLRGEYQVCIPFDNPAPPNDIVTVRLQLPAGVRCSRCTLRWTYRTSYPNGAPDWNNCYTAAPAQTFRNCADISIN